MIRDNRLDLLKAAAIILILILHLAPLPINNRTSFLSIYVGLLAVPILFIISFYIFFNKSFEDRYYIKKRLYNLFILYLFWEIIQYIIYQIINKYANHPVSDDFQSYISQVWAFWPLGDFRSIHGNYFLFDLMILTVMAYVLIMINQDYAKYIAAIMIVLSIVYILNNSLKVYEIGNFVIYVPCAYIMTRNDIFKYKWYFLIGYLASSALQIANISQSVSTYGRLPVIFGALTLFCFIMSYQVGRSKSLLFLSDYSLGILYTHRYWQLLSVIIVSHIIAPNTYYFALIIAIMTIIMTLASMGLLGKTRLKRFI